MLIMCTFCHTGDYGSFQQELYDQLLCIPKHFSYLGPWRISLSSIEGRLNDVILTVAFNGYISKSCVLMAIIDSRPLILLRLCKSNCFLVAFFRFSQRHKHSSFSIAYAP
jgi:hypothetical protein